MARRIRPKKKNGLKTALQAGRSDQTTQVVLCSLAAEESRAQTLDSIGLLDTPPDERFDRICRLAQDLMQTPATYVALIDRHRQWFKSTCGMGVLNETPREGSFCDYAIQKSTPTVILDATKDPFFAKSPYVIDSPKVRFYIGFPLTVEGHRVGTLCALDFEPRSCVSDQQMKEFNELARLAESELTVRVQQTSECPQPEQGGETSSS